MDGFFYGWVKYVASSFKLVVWQGHLCWQRSRLVITPGQRQLPVYTLKFPHSGAITAGQVAMPLLQPETNSKELPSEKNAVSSYSELPRSHAQVQIQCASAPT
jgi:hypothetical protein